MLLSFDLSSAASFTGTELDFALDVSNAVIDVWGPYIAYICCSSQGVAVQELAMQSGSHRRLKHFQLPKVEANT